jgi:hypothetical protein
MTDTTPPTDARLRSSLLVFGLAYLVMSALVTAVLVVFDRDAPGGVAIGVLVAAIVIGARKFVVDNKRALTRGEQLRFALLALGIILLISIVQVIALVPLVIGRAALPSAVADLKAGIAENATAVALVTAVVVLIYFAVLYFISGWFSRRFAKRLATNGRI